MVQDFRINYGQTFSYFKKITVSDTGFGSSSSSDGYRPPVQFPFVCQGFSLMNETTTTSVDVSFNGFDIHDQLNSALSTGFVQYDNRVVSKIWFKIASGSATITVRAWGIR